MDIYLIKSFYDVLYTYNPIQELDNLSNVEYSTLEELKEDREINETNEDIIAMADVNLSAIVEQFIYDGFKVDWLINESIGMYSQFELLYLTDDKMYVLLNNQY